MKPRGRLTMLKNLPTTLRCTAPEIYRLSSTSATIMLKLCIPLCATLTPFRPVEQVGTFLLAPVCGSAFTLTCFDLNCDCV